jgi:hypothetical protein
MNTTNFSYYSQKSFQKSIFQTNLPLWLSLYKTQSRMHSGVGKSKYTNSFKMHAM